MKDNYIIIVPLVVLAMLCGVGVMTGQVPTRDNNVAIAAWWPGDDNPSDGDMDQFERYREVCAAGQEMIDTIMATCPDTPARRVACQRVSEATAWAAVAIYSE